MPNFKNLSKNVRAAMDYSDPELSRMGIWEPLFPAVKSNKAYTHKKPVSRKFRELVAEGAS